MHFLLIDAGVTLAAILGFLTLFAVRRRFAPVKVSRSRSAANLTGEHQLISARNSELRALQASVTYVDPRRLINLR